MESTNMETPTVTACPENQIVLVGGVYLYYSPTSERGPIACKIPHLYEYAADHYIAISQRVNKEC